MNIDGVELSLDNLTQDLLELLVGERWPNGDEGAMRSLAAAWSEAAAQLEEIRQTATAAARQVAEHCQGPNGDGFQSFWSANFDDGRTSWPSGAAPAALPFAVRFCRSMADALNAGATQIETTKDTIMGNIAILVATVAPQIAAGFFDFGATDATAVGEILADRAAMQVFLDGAKELVTEVVEQAIEQGLQQAELNFVIQFKEVMEGHASGIDWSAVGQVGLSGAQGGALGAGFGFGLGKAGGRLFGEGFGNVAGRMATGVASGGLTNASLDLIENGKVSASDFTKGSLAGVLGGMGGAEAAAGERPALETEHLPAELTTPQQVDLPPHPSPESVPGSVPAADLAVGAVPSGHTDLSGLTAPDLGAGTGTVIDSGPGMGVAAGEGGGWSGSGPDSRGGISLDPVQASAASSSIARILDGSESEGGGTREADTGAGVSGVLDSPAATPSDRFYGRRDSGEADDGPAASPGSASASAYGDRAAGLEAESSASASATVTADPPRGDLADSVSRDRVSPPGQDPAGDAPVRPVSETETASARATTDESEPVDSRNSGVPESGAQTASVVRDDSAPDDATSEAQTESPVPETLPTTGPIRPEQAGPGEPARTAPGGAKTGESATVGNGDATWHGSEPAASGREPASSRPDAERPKPDSAPAGVARSEAPKTEAPKTEAPKPEAAGAEANNPGAGGVKPDAPRPADGAVPNRPGARRDSGNDSGNDSHADQQPGIIYQTDLGPWMRDASAQPASWNPQRGLTGELAEVSARAQVGERGIANFSDRAMADLARKVQPDPAGAFTGDIHGDARGVFSGLTRMTPEEYLRVLDANGHEPGQPIRLLSCEAGALDDGFAARLARVSGCKVVAADTEVWSDEAGHLFASGTHTDGFGEPAPDIPPNGTWHEFSPDGTRTEVGEGGFPPGHEDGFGNWGAPVGDVRSRDAAQQDPAEVARATLERLRGQWPELDRALTGNPVARDSLLSHPDSVRMLHDALGDVQGRLDAAGIADAVRGGEVTSEVQAKVDSIIGDLRAADPNQVLDRPEQLAIGKDIAAGTTRDGYRQPGFDLSRRADPQYQEECVDRLRAQAAQAQDQLNRIVSGIAAGNGGEASWRPQVKDRARALKKVREYVEEIPDGDASMLVDVVGAKIRFGSVDELYRALAELKDDPRVDIVRIKDRVARATESGNRSILMNVRLAGGHVAELKFGLKSFETPAAAEHPLYEVRRDLDSIALAERRPLTPVESLIKAATEAHARREYGAAWNRETAGSRLHELLTDHPDVASIAQRLVFDSALHPTNVATSLADPATRDATIAAIGELADGHALAGRTLEEYRAANPGEGPLFEPVDPSVNTTADGRDRKTVFLGEAGRADPARDVGAAPTPQESALLGEYARRLREEVQPAVEAEVRGLARLVGDGASVSVRTKSMEGILDKVDRMTNGSVSRPARPGYRAGDVIDAVGARITARDMHDLARILEAAKSHFGVGDGGRILEIDNMYAAPKSKNPAYRVIPLVVRVEVDGRPYTFELQLTTRRASIAADLEHNTLFKPYVEMSRAEKATVKGMLAEAAALDQEETRWDQ